MPEYSFTGLFIFWEADSVIKLNIGLTHGALLPRMADTGRAR